MQQSYLIGIESGTWRFLHTLIQNGEFNMADNSIWLIEECGGTVGRVSDC